MFSPGEFRLKARAFDTETRRMQRGNIVPPLVCASVAWLDGDTIHGELLSGGAKFRGSGRDALDVSVDLLTDKIIVGAHLAFDMAVMALYAAKHKIDLLPLIFKAYKEGRIIDILLVQQLDAIANGTLGFDPRTGGKIRDPITRKLAGYSLSTVNELVLDEKDAKEHDEWRLNYGDLESIPIEDWPENARIYPVDDVKNPFKVALAQYGLIPRPSDHEWHPRKDECIHCKATLTISSRKRCTPRAWSNENLQDVSAQSFAAFCLHLGAAWGFAVDVERVINLKAQLQEKREKGLVTYLAAGLMRVEKKKGEIKHAKNQGFIKRMIAHAYGCVEKCQTCQGTGKVKSAKSGKLVGDRACDSTGINLDSGPVPRTPGSKCRTCKGTRILTDKKTGVERTCGNCEVQDERMPGCAMSRDAMNESGEEILIEFAAFLEDAKLLQTYLPFLEQGISDIPDEEDEDSEAGDE